MKVLFVYPNLTRQEYIPMGIAHLSSAIKAAGHSPSLMDYTWGGGLKDCLDKINGERPDIIAITMFSGMKDFVTGLAREIKNRFDVPVIAGGPHPTVAPEETMSIPFVDMICVGEGEDTICELLAMMGSKQDLDVVQGLWFKRDGIVVKNEVRSLKEDLDEYPFPDRELFDFQRYLNARDGVVDVITGRGCPYSCTYCINPYLQKLYKGKGSFIRKRRVEHVVSEIAQLLKQYPIKGVAFQDDIFVLSKGWLAEFADLYGKEIGLPFTCNARPETVDKERMGLLKKANCVSISIGIESGNEKIRREVLRRPLTDQAIIRAFDLAAEAGIATYSYNIIGVPYETREDIKKTIELNRKARPSSLQVTVFQPYPGTELRALSVEKGWLAGEDVIPESHKFYSIMKYPHVSKREIERERVFFRYNVIKSENYINALLFLLFDLFFASYTKVRGNTPVFIKKLLFRVEGIIRRG
jgi:radical SAM superfamily enzyme YgiQ (UPF0313 family)